MTTAGHAVVIGGSLAGLAAARALRDRYAYVTILEQDRFPTEPGGRRGTPQAWHNHFLLDVGRETLDELFPGFREHLLANGGLELDPAYDAVSCLADRWAPRCRSTMRMLFASRPTVEATVRRLLLRDPDVELREGVRVLGLVHDGTGPNARVRGVRIAGVPGELAADLVVDASGRGSKVRTYLRELGHEIEELTLDAKVSYSSRWYRWPEQADWWRWLTIFPAQDDTGPDEHRYLCSIFPIEHDGFIAVMGSWGLPMPTDVAGYEAAAAKSRSREFAAMVAAGTPISDVHHTRSTRNVWRRLDRLATPPAGYLAVGDAVCAFNPIYAQGMSAAAMNAALLRAALADTEDTTTSDLPRTFYARQAEFLAKPWALAMSRDGGYPHAVGTEALPDGPRRRLLERYTWRGFTFITNVSWADPVVDEHFSRVFNLREPLSRFLTDPRVVWGMARYGVRAALGRSPVPRGSSLADGPSAHDYTRDRYGADHPPKARAG